MKNSTPSEKKYLYDAFISYPRDPDKNLAVGIQHGLRSLGAKKYLLRFRALNIFRDETDFAGHSSLKSKIEFGLDNSEYLVVLASPKIARSTNKDNINWIEEEIKYWIKSKHKKEWETNTHIENLKIIICLIRGEVQWDYVENDFDWQKTSALPPTLANKFQSEPQWIDFRAINLINEHSLDNYSLDNPEFKKKIAELSAQIQNISVDQIIGEDIKRKRLWSFITGMVLTILIVLATITYLFQNQSIINLRLANANQLATISIQNSLESPTEALFLAKTAYEKVPENSSQAGKALSHCFYDPINNKKLFYAEKIVTKNIVRNLQFLGDTKQFIFNSQGEDEARIYNCEGIVKSSKKFNAPIIKMCASNKGDCIAVTTENDPSLNANTGMFYYWKMDKDSLYAHQCNTVNDLRTDLGFSSDDNWIAWNAGNKLFLYNTLKNSLDSIEHKHPIKGFHFLEKYNSILVVSGWLISEEYKVSIYDYSLNLTKDFTPNKEIVDF